MSWELESLTARKFFYSKNYSRAQNLYESHFKNSSSTLVDLNTGCSYQLAKDIEQLLITVDCLCEVYQVTNNLLLEIKIHIKTLDLLLTLLDKSAHDLNRYEMLQKFFNRVYLNYCRAINGVHVEFSNKLLRDTMGGTQSLNEINSLLNFYA